MATERSLNQIVKGAPPPDTKIPPVAPLPPLADASSDAVSQISRPKQHSKSRHVSRPSVVDASLSALPSAPPQIYLNLLILEASLRAQYLHLLSRRRLNTFFLLLLALWNGFFIWALFLKPREDGQGHGGSVYWVIETAERLALMGGLLSVLLLRITGQWERGIRWPRRWLGTTNRGLRGFNLRVVVTKGKWWSDVLGYFAFLLPFGLWMEAGGSDWHLVEHESGTIVEEDLAKGGRHIMLLLLPKNFSSEFRENWEAYRTEYWDKENDRRTALRKKVKQNRRDKAKEQGGWKWWTGFWRLVGMANKDQRKGQDLEKHPHARHSHNYSKEEALFKASRRRSLLRDGSHSRQSSRSSIPHATEFDGSVDMKPLSERVRRASSVSSTSSVRRSTRSGRRDGKLSPLTAADEDGLKEKRTRKKEKGEKSKGSDSRPTTPDTESIEFAKRVPQPA